MGVVEGQDCCGGKRPCIGHFAHVLLPRALHRDTPMLVCSALIGRRCIQAGVCTVTRVRVGATASS